MSGIILTTCCMATVSKSNIFCPIPEDQLLACWMAVTVTMPSAAALRVSSHPWRVMTAWLLAANLEASQYVTPTRRRRAVAIERAG